MEILMLLHKRSGIEQSNAYLVQNLKTMTCINHLQINSGNSVTYN